jgi:ADP-ribosylglycohydrolase
MSDWLTLPMLRAEITQRTEEGCYTDDLAAKAAALGDRATVAELLSAWAEVEGRSPTPYFPYREPSDLWSIRCERPAGPRQLSLALGRDELRDRIRGAWIGRAAGCLLGKPVEGWSRERIRKVLEHAGEYPLADYFPYLDSPPADADYRGRPRNWFRGAIDHMVRDDDMDYPVLGLKLLEAKGRDFTTDDVAANWLTSLPFSLVYTAERVAYRNLVDGLIPPASAWYKNPFREWIGAQIRADIWGYVAPGNPELAAEYAFRDAAVSHVKNGIYGEMLSAAMISASFVSDDVEEIVGIGLAEIPEKCRLAEAVKNTVKWCGADGDWEKTLDRIHAEYGHYHGVHTINNAALVVMGLLYSGLDLEPAICLTVMGGWDTDCTGATAGSIIGAIRGASALPGKWVGPIGDRLESIVIGYTENSFADLTERTLRAAGLG